MNTKQIMIIGLGQFGMALARTLSEKGAEVIAMDILPDLVEEASSFATDAVCLDATDETALAKFHPEEKDSVICTIGSREASILCTALLRQMGVKMICARSLDTMHKRILKAVGAHEIVNPEYEFGRRYANKVLYRKVISDEDLSNGLEVNEIRAMPFMIGKTLAQLALPKRYDVIVAAIRHHDNPKMDRPDPVQPIEEEDRLLVLGDEQHITKLLEDNQ